MKILSISSHVVAGMVGNSAACPAFAALGIEAWSLPTVVYSETPSPDGFAGDALSDALFDRLLSRFEETQAARALAAIHIGYVRAPFQAHRIAAFLGAARKLNPAILVSLDPILGDDGALYVPAETAAAVRDYLVPHADILTPNRFELAWLSSRKLTSPEEALNAARGLGAPTVAVTSAPSAPDRCATLLVRREGAHLVTTPHLPSAPHGTGDVLAALFLSRILRGEAPEQAIALAVASVFDLIGAAKSAGALPLPERADLLAAPASRFPAVSLAAR